MRSACAFLALALAVSPARAHFIFLVPDKDQKTVSMVFTDTLRPDEGVAISKIGKTNLFALDAAGKSVPVKMAEHKHHYEITVPGPRPVMIGGACQYGVSTRKVTDPYRIVYYAKTVLLSKSELPDGLPWMTEGSKALTLDIVLAGPKEHGKVKVLFQGKPLGGAEIVLTHGEDGEELEKGMTDKDGIFDVAAAMKAAKVLPTLAALRAKHVEKTPGELDGKKYNEIRHYCTFTVHMPPKEMASGKFDRLEEVALLGKDKDADLAATKLLADARAARALWNKFPGFFALVEINQDGHKIPCTLNVTPAGKVALKADLADLTEKQEETIKKVRGEIGSLVSHRMPGEAYETPCAFADKIEDHPQGRLINVLNDELHSSYRIRDRQILEVNRVTGGGRFTITVLENTWNKDKTYLPAHYVVHSWDKSGTLTSASAHRNTWLRMGAFDLPESYTTTTASSGGLSVRTVTFRGHKLGE